MNALIAGVTDAQTMSSREIAELTGKEHRNVMRDIRVMLVELHGEGGVLSFEHTLPNDQNGQAYPIYRLPKRESLILVSGYSVQMRAKIIDRWQELEAKAAPDPMVALNDPTVMRGLLLSYSEKVLTLQAQNAELAVKGDALDRIATAEGSLCITDAAKTMQERPRAVFAALRAKRWIYSRQGSGDIAYQDKIAAGWLEHKTTTVERSDGSTKVVTQVRVTPKGLARLAELLGSDWRPDGAT